LEMVRIDDRHSSRRTRTLNGQRLKSAPLASSVGIILRLTTNRDVASPKAELSQFVLE
jgi:hypothetical protein